MKKLHTKLMIAVTALSLSTNAVALPSQVPDRYYEHRNFLHQVWGEIVCANRSLWWCVYVP